MSEGWCVRDGMYHFCGEHCFESQEPEMWGELQSELRANPSYCETDEAWAWYTHYAEC